MKQSILKVAVLGALTLTTACAQTPSAIVPVSMAGAYSHISCSSARTILATEQQSYAALAQQQNAAVAGDAIGVLLLGVPVSSLTGSDVTGEIAANKGKRLALQARLASC